MNQDHLPYSETGYFSKTILDYICGEKNLQSFFGNTPDLNGFKNQIELKRNFSKSHRKQLVETLKNQYQVVATSDLVLDRIESLSNENTFTVTTGHQLNLFTGPLYFLYKIISVINLCKTLKESYPKCDFVPIYWMATEDHDFEEINHFHLKGKVFRWEGQEHQSGAVGKFKTENLDTVLELLSSELGSSDAAKDLKGLFKRAYTEHQTLGEATFYLANELFKEDGLVVLEPNNVELKRLFIPQIKRDLFDQIGFKKVNDTIELLQKKAYSIQVNPRKLNFFYLKEGLRERFVEEGGVYSVLNTAIQFTKDELITELEQHPDRFSPNVITRPLYQEAILPNLAYIGGGGELAYWFELKSMFEAQEIIFPILMLRDSVLVMSQKQYDKIQKLGLSIADLFLSRGDLINRHIRKISNIDIDLSPLKNRLNEQFENLYQIASQTDASFLGAVKAQEIKQLKGIDKLEKRLLKAQKQKLGQEVVRLVNLQEELFPREGLQERNTNFSEFYLEYSTSFKKELLTHLNPLKKEFIILKL